MYKYLIAILQKQYFVPSLIYLPSLFDFRKWYKYQKIFEYVSFLMASQVGVTFFVRFKNVHIQIDKKHFFLSSENSAYLPFWLLITIQHGLLLEKTTTIWPNLQQTSPIKTNRDPSRSIRIKQDQSRSIRMTMPNGFWSLWISQKLI